MADQMTPEKIQQARERARSVETAADTTPTPSNSNQLQNLELVASDYRDQIARAINAGMRRDIVDDPDWFTRSRDDDVRRATNAVLAVRDTEMERLQAIVSLSSLDQEYYPGTKANAVMAELAELRAEVDLTRRQMRGDR